MVHIKSFKKSYMLECNGECVYWSKPNASPLKMSCTPDSDEYTFGIGIESDKKSNELYNLDATKKFLKSIDRTKNVLPITIDFDSFDNYTEYTDVSTNDACNVPKYECNNVSFSIDNGNSNEAGLILFQNNGTPWFVGDCYEMPDQAWFEYNDTEYDEDFMNKFTDIEVGSAELANFYSYFIDRMLESIEKREKILARQAVAKKNKEAKEQERINTALNKLVNNNIADEVKNFSKTFKIDIEKAVEFANNIYLKLNK